MVSSAAAATWPTLRTSRPRKSKSERGFSVSCPPSKAPRRSAGWWCWPPATLCFTASALIWCAPLVPKTSGSTPTSHRLRMPLPASSTPGRTSAWSACTAATVRCSCWLSQRRPIGLPFSPTLCIPRPGWRACYWKTRWRALRSASWSRWDPRPSASPGLHRRLRPKVFSPDPTWWS